MSFWLACIRRIERSPGNDQCPVVPYDLKPTSLLTTTVFESCVLKRVFLDEVTKAHVSRIPEQSSTATL